MLELQIKVVSFSKGEYILVEEFAGKYKIKVKHLACGTEITCKKSDFFNEKIVIPCVTCNKIKSKEQKTAEINDILLKDYKGNFNLMNNYNGSTEKLRIKHVICGNEIDVLPQKIFKRKLTCVSCKKEDKLKEVKKKLDEQNDDFEFISAVPSEMDYNSVYLIHKTCESKITATINRILNGNLTCDNCQSYGIKNKRKSNKTDEKIEQLRLTIKAENPNYELKEGTYVSASNFHITHVNCGNSHKTSQIKFFKKRLGCPYCEDPFQRKMENVQKKVTGKPNEKIDQLRLTIKAENPNYELKEGTYVNDSSFYITHVNCGNSHKTSQFKFFKKGLGCPYCEDTFNPKTENIQKKATSKVDKKIDQLRLTIKVENPDYELKEGTYVNDSNFHITHVNCGNSHKTSQVKFFKKGLGCPYCEDTFDYKMENIKKKVKSKLIGYEDSFELIDIQEDFTKLVCKDCSRVSNFKTIQVIQNKKLNCLTCYLTNDLNDYLNSHLKNYELISNQVENKECELEVLHKKCNSVIKTSYKKMKTTKEVHCTLCHKEKIRLSKEIKLLEKLKIETNDEYSLQGKYISYLEYINLKHSVCGETFKTTMNDFFNKNSRCPFCNGNRVNSNIFFKKLKEKHGEEFEILSDFQNMSSEIKFRHIYCGNEYTKSAGSLINAKMPCDFCNGRFRNKFEVEKKIKELAGEEYSLIGDFIDSSTMTFFKHNKCGHIYQQAPTRFIKNGYRCPKCIGRNKTQEEIEGSINELTSNSYAVKTSYRGMSHPFVVEHLTCGFNFETTPFNFINQSKRCPNCIQGKRSKGELAIKEYMDEKGINYQREYRIEECKYIVPLPFDFAVLKGKDLICLIEFDGKQHFEPIDFYGGEEYFNGIQIRDNIKTNFCIDNNIPLLRIPYFDLNKINEILDKFLNNL